MADITGSLQTLGFYSDGLISDAGGDVSSRPYYGSACTYLYPGVALALLVRPPYSVFYKMRARDSGAAYVTWIVQDSPDFAGSGYSGGSPTPVGPMVAGSAVVASEWFVEGS